MANYNRLGGLPFDPASFENPEVRQLAEALALYMSGMGEPNPATESGDVEYAGVYAFDEGGGVYSLWGGNPADPENPIDLDLESGAGGSTDSFNPIAVAGQDDVTADSSAEELTFVAGANITITTDNTGKTVTWAASGALGEYFKTIVVSGSSDVVADTADDTLTFAVANNQLAITTSADTITWALQLNNCPNYASSETKLLGHIDDDADVAEWDFVYNWLKTLTGYTGSGIELLGASSGTVQWKSLAAWLNLLTDYSSGVDQSIGHDASGSTAWQDDDEC